jgi:hypothetical protein
MAEPENHTLRLLREIRSQGEKLEERMDRGFAELRERIVELARLTIGEGV